MEFSDVLKNRRSIRKYTGDQIPEEKLNLILQAGLLAPSSRNLYPVEMIVVRDKQMLFQLSRAKTAGSGMLKDADAAIVVIGDAERSDAWTEDCSVAMIYMQLQAAELGIGNCWVQCRGRTSQQKEGEPLAQMPDDTAQSKDHAAQRTENSVAAAIAKDKTLTGHLSATGLIRMLLGIPERYEVEAILSLGMPDQDIKPHDMPDITPQKVHRERWDNGTEK